MGYHPGDTYGGEGKTGGGVKKSHGSIISSIAHGLFILCSKNDSSLEAHSTEFAENSLQT